MQCTRAVSTLASGSATHALSRPPLTASRTLRAQLQALLGAPSIDAAAELVATGQRHAKQAAAPSRRHLLM